MENFLKGKLEELAKERAEYGRRKAEALGRIASLGLKLTNNEILLDNYSAEVSEAKETIRRYENTIAYYDKCAADIERQLEDEQNAARRAKTAKQAIPLAISAMILLATFGIFIASEGAITGFFARETVTAYEQALSISASQAQAYAWQPENAETAENTTAPAENATDDAAIVPENATSPVEAAPENATTAKMPSKNYLKSLPFRNLHE